MLLGLQILPLLVIFLLAAPRRWAAMVFSVGVIFVPMGANLSLGSLSLYPVRILVLAGLLRCALRREYPDVSSVPCDRLVVLFALVMAASSVFREDVVGTFTNRMALSIDTVGTYVLFRTWISDWKGLSQYMRSMLVFLLPLGVFMSIEYITRRNLFHFVGGLPLESELREGSVRARGPFRHSILAGTFGAVALPMALAMWRSEPRLARLGACLSFLVVFLSTSGGPIMTLGAVVLALTLWFVRARMRIIVRGALIGLVFLHIVMKAPVWYLIARIDVGGGGYHRARLIDSAVQHFSDWWLAGTEYTRHWMPTGVTWSENHTDITNNFLRMGVIGGLPLMLTFVGFYRESFKELAVLLDSSDADSQCSRFGAWCLGCSLFGHGVAMMSVSYYDQSSAIFISLVAGIASGSAAICTSREDVLARGREDGAVDVADVPSMERAVSGGALALTVSGPGQHCGVHVSDACGS
ncbi:MAG TPA: hypothetical protein PKM43_14685 [Verrucomicrobiota bacterium]|nr:hypothetical protein [Verrucomicrobiota bacterium]